MKLQPSVENKCVLSRKDKIKLMRLRITVVITISEIEVKWMKTERILVNCVLEGLQKRFH